ncbi:hypothetical protein GCM10020370_45480 [Paenibacillus hodogayensis]
MEFNFDYAIIIVYVFSICKEKRASLGFGLSQETNLTPAFVKTGVEWHLDRSTVS